MDIFCEYMVKRRKGAKDFLLILGIIFVAVLLSFELAISMGGISFALVCGVWFGAWWLITRTYIEYEYILTSTILDIDKIMAKRSRKRILSIDLREISAFCGIGDMPEGNVKIIDATPNGTEDGVYAVDFDKSGQKTRLLFKPDKKMLAKIKKASPRLVTIETEDIEE